MQPKPSITRQSEAARADSPTEYRFQLLDAMRGLAALLVVLYHQPLELQSRFHASNSFLAVDFFFCLSGFVVAHAYADRLRNGLTLQGFALIRLIRLYPLFAMSIVIGIVRSFISPVRLQALGTTTDLNLLFGSSFLLVPNLFVGGLGGELFPLNAPAWSLLLELMANVGYGWAMRQRVVIQALGMGGAVSLLILIAAVLRGHTLDYGAEMHGLGYGFARVGFSFAAGVALLRHYRRSGQQTLRGGKGLFTAAALPVVLLATMLLADRFTKSGFYQIFVVTLVFPAIVYVGARCAMPKALVPMCAFLGELSYPLYILHVPLMLPYSNLFAMSFIRAHETCRPYLVFVDLGILVPICWWTGYHVDRPIRLYLTRTFGRLWAGTTFFPTSPATS